MPKCPACGADIAVGAQECQSCHVTYDEPLVREHQEQGGRKMGAVECYTEMISRDQPSVIMFLIDQSGSMGDSFGGMLEGVANPTKEQGAADALNRCLQNIVIRCTKEEGVRNYFDIGVIGYGASVGPVLGGILAKRELVPIAEVADAPLRVEERTREVPDAAGGLTTETVRLPIWVDPKAEGRTPMCEALQLARRVIEPWLSSHAQSYPPTVINITDGASTDGEPGPMAKELKALANANGSNLLAFNIHLCDARVPSVLYPAHVGGLTDGFAKQLFEMSSLLPPKLVAEAAAGRVPVVEGSRGFVFNGSLADLIRFLDIGTRMTAMTDVRPGR